MLNPDRTGWHTTALLILALAGCAPLEWHKSGAAEEQIAADRDHCAAGARSEAFRQQAPMRNPVPQVVVDPQGRAIAVKPASSDNERFALEQDLLRKCMHDLGYELQQKNAPSKP
jgi:hypothetical protein